MSKIPSQYYLPFANGLTEVFQQFGVTDISRSNLELKENLYMDYEVCLIVGITDDIQGNLGISMPSPTAQELASIAMGGMEVPQLDEMAKSAITEISNMVTAAAARTFSSMEKNVDITPPTLVVGEDIIMIISQVETLSLSLKSSVGTFQINIGLETVK